MHRNSIQMSNVQESLLCIICTLSVADTELSLPASFSFNKVHFELNWEIEATLSWEIEATLS